MATKGQRLYEFKARKTFQLWTTRAPWGTPVDVPNPDFTPWQFLTAACRASWEVTAVGHNLFSGESGLFINDGTGERPTWAQPRGV